MPEEIDIHQLSPEDLPAIRVWAEGRMIAALGCAIERVHEFSINDSIPVYFKKGCE